MGSGNLWPSGSVAWDFFFFLLENNRRSYPTEMTYAKSRPLAPVTKISESASGFSHCCTRRHKRGRQSPSLSVSSSSLLISASLESIPLSLTHTQPLFFSGKQFQAFGITVKLKLPVLVVTETSLSRFSVSVKTFSQRDESHGNYRGTPSFKSMSSRKYLGIAAMPLEMTLYFHKPHPLDDII